jgi:hypothetical protein
MTDTKLTIVEVKQTSEQGGIKANVGKPRMSLIPNQALTEVARVFTMGEAKYSSNNWRKGMPWSWNIDAALRHIGKFNDGIDLDDESKLSHLAHAITDLMFVLEYQLTETGTDDRYKSNNIRKTN